MYQKQVDGKKNGVKEMGIQMKDGRKETGGMKQEAGSEDIKKENGKIRKQCELIKGWI